MSENSFMLQTTSTVPSLVKFSRAHHSLSIVTHSFPCHNIVVSMLAPCIINLLRIIFIIHRGPWLNGFGLLKLCLRNAFFHHFFRTLPPWCGYHNGKAFQVFFSGADMRWHQSRNEAKWMQFVAFVAPTKWVKSQSGKHCGANDDSGRMVIMTIPWGFGSGHLKGTL